MIIVKTLALIVLASFPVVSAYAITEAQVKAEIQDIERAKATDRQANDKGEADEIAAEDKLPEPERSEAQVKTINAFRAADSKILADAAAAEEKVIDEETQE
jgi:hypothetical protein